MRTKPVISILLALVAVASLLRAEPTPKVDEKVLAKVTYSDLTDVKKFFTVYVLLDGSAEKIGLDRKELSDFVKLRFKNLFTGFPIEELPKNEQGLPADGINEREWANLFVVVWTVGDDYPVAYHIELKMGKFRGGGWGYSDASLGYASAKTLKDGRVIKDTISDLMERAAATLFRIQDKL